jgi:uncharacterized membrane protein
MALGVGLLLAVSPHVARWDTVVRHYAPQTLAVLGVAASLWGIAAAKCLRARWWLLPALGFATLAALMTHFMAALFMPGLGLWLLLVNGKTHWRRTALAGATMIAALIVFGNLWGPSLREQLTRTGFEDSVAGVRFIDNFPLQPSLPQRLLASMDGQSMTLAIFPGWWMWGMNALLWIVMVGYLLRLIRSGFDRVDGLLLLWLFGAPAMVLLVNTIRPATAVYTWRHFMAASPAAAILFVRGFAWLLDRVRRSAAP